MTWKHLFAYSVGTLLLAMPASAEFLSAELSVNGLSCPFCVFGIEKKLLDVPGVSDVEVFLDEGRIAIKFEVESAATVKDLEEAVRKAGFEVVGLTVETNGAIQSRENGEFRFVAHPDMTFRLREVIEGHEERVSEEILRKLRAAASPDGHSLIIEGTVSEREAQEPLLVVRRIQPLPGSKD